MKYLIELAHDTKPLSCSSGNRAKMLLKGHLSIKVHTKYDHFTSLLIDYAWAGSIKMSTSQRTPNTLQNLSKLTDLMMRIELTRAILMSQFSNFLRNSTIYFCMCLYLVTYFLIVTVSLL